jgi:hypothetical protein
LFIGDKSAKNLALYEKSRYIRYKQTEDISGIVAFFLEKNTEGGAALRLTA